MLDVERQMSEKELGRLALAALEGIHGTEFFSSIIENEAACTLQRIQDILDNEQLNDFECVEEIVHTLRHVGITTSRHDLG